MMSIFEKNARSNLPQKGTPEYTIRRFEIARINLMTAILMTVINIVLDLTGSDSYFLFSISFPYYEFDKEAIPMMVVCTAILGFYVLAWLLSKKKPGWMIAALVAFALDCVYLVVFSFFVVQNFSYAASYRDFILEYAFHIWVLVYLIIGVCSCKKYREAIAAVETAASTASAE